jgi:predicted dehydrogenase
MLKIGFIGFGNHAARLKKCLNETLGYCDIVSYHPTKHDPQITNDFDDVCACDTIFITSPNKTHFRYIKQLLQKTNSKIFCEKPPCVSASELDELRRLDPESKGRIFFNFNYRYSSLCQLIKSSIADGSIGSVVNITGVLSHGLAFKEGYSNSWRGKYPINESVVLDTSLIHIIDLCNYVLNGPLEIKCSSSKSFKHGLDSFFIGLETENKVNISLFGSYAAPYCFSLQVLGTNGLIEAGDASLVLKAPRDTFNKEGFFITPPECISNKYSFELDYQDSLKSAVNHFITHAISGESFSIVDFDLSLETTKLVCDAQLSG